MLLICSWWIIILPDYYQSAYRPLFCMETTICSVFNGLLEIMSEGRSAAFDMVVREWLERNWSCSQCIKIFSKLFKRQKPLFQNCELFFFMWGSNQGGTATKCTCLGRFYNLYLLHDWSVRCYKDVVYSSNYLMIVLSFFSVSDFENTSAKILEVLKSFEDWMDYKYGNWN